MRFTDAHPFLLHETVAKFRKQVGITQEELAQAVGVSVATISKIESGRNPNPTGLILAKLAHELDVTVDVLLGLRPDE